MLLTLLFSFGGGLLGANAVPHFVKGITKERYPCLFGNSPVPNLLAGWVGLILAGWLLYAADLREHPAPCAAAAAIGALLIGLFHAQIGAFGRKE